MDIASKTIQASIYEQTWTLLVMLKSNAQLPANSRYAILSIWFLYFLRSAILFTSIHPLGFFQLLNTIIRQIVVLTFIRGSLTFIKQWENFCWSMDFWNALRKGPHHSTCPTLHNWSWTIFEYKTSFIFMLNIQICQWNIVPLHLFCLMMLVYIPC